MEGSREEGTLVFNQNLRSLQVLGLREGSSFKKEQTCGSRMDFFQVCVAGAGERWKIESVRL